MLHGFEEQASPPTEAGEVCRQVNSCVPIELYYEYVKPAPELEIGGKRAFVLSVSGRLFSLPVSMLSTAAPALCESQDHADLHAAMVAVHVQGTREASKSKAGGKRRETTLERRSRLARWESELRNA